MATKFREDRATQAAAKLLSLSNGRLNVLSLIKLLYFIDREALLRWGRPITFDSYYSMPHGPVVSFTLNLIDMPRDPVSPSYWHRYISERKDHEVQLLKDVPNDQLSEAEELLIDEVFQKYQGYTQWELRDLSHKLPEWRDPHGSSVPITVRDILEAEGISEVDIREVEEFLDAEADICNGTT